ncbi:hypothetical protein CALCODRAFT_330593 [Calocera cornea HHB12733]|uniref:Uncharacterized protein n=1 Tax=Calocera cornea HHB12733 TaxID=1353952 RepID=A0A165F3S4_9BASI|nr:hypothetical protein CALCODRAFT_330593 [Calocera cornea HHB12733]
MSMQRGLSCARSVLSRVFPQADFSPGRSLPRSISSQTPRLGLSWTRALLILVSPGRSSPPVDLPSAWCVLSLISNQADLSSARSPARPICPQPDLSSAGSQIAPVSPEPDLSFA